jgi:nicotinate-nucleotide adenylyltransferase
MGGTFDPIHCGHLQAAQEVSKLLQDADVHLIPAKIPVHKAQPSTQVEQRISMLQLAIEDYPRLKLDLREIRATNPAFTIDTLRQLRRELAMDVPLVMVIGMDSYQTLGQWKHSDDILKYCHLIVLQRPKYQIQLGQQAVYQTPVAKCVEHLLTSANGLIYFFEQEPIDISASEIRDQIINSETPNLLPPKVAQYINTHQLYQAGVRPQ